MSSYNNITFTSADDVVVVITVNVVVITVNVVVITVNVVVITVNVVVITVNVVVTAVATFSGYNCSCSC